MREMIYAVTSSLLLIGGIDSVTDKIRHTNGDLTTPIELAEQTLKIAFDESGQVTDCAFEQARRDYSWMAQVYGAAKGCSL